MTSGLPPAHQGLKIWHTDGRFGSNYVPTTFDDLAVHVDEMAAVAWDRDQDEVLRGREVVGDLRALVSTRDDRRKVSLMTGYMCALARWDEDEKRWCRL